jgi:hypothetical protein
MPILVTRENNFDVFFVNFRKKFNIFLTPKTLGRVSLINTCDYGISFA